MKLELIFEHTLALDELRRRLEARAAHWDQKKPALGIRSSFRWTSDRRVEAEARGGRGQMTLSEDHVRVELELPFFARPFRSRIEAFVRDEAAAVLSGETDR
jgi:hypothetical protein